MSVGQSIAGGLGLLGWLRKRKARALQCDLKQELATEQELATMMLIDAVQLLRGFSKSQVLMHDGAHLSELGQQVFDEEITNSIIADLASSRVFW
jgi:hypothetical protein